MYYTGRMMRKDLGGISIGNSSRLFNIGGEDLAPNASPPCNLNSLADLFPPSFPTHFSFTTIVSSSTLSALWHSSLPLPRRNTITTTLPTKYHEFYSEDRSGLSGPEGGRLLFIHNRCMVSLPLTFSVACTHLTHLTHHSK